MSTARAAVIHRYLPEVSEKLNEPIPAVGPHGETIATPGPLGNINNGLTVDSGLLYVADGPHGNETSRIDAFNAGTGGFSGQLPTPVGAEFLHQSPVVGRSTGEPQLYVGGDRRESENEPRHGVVEVMGLDGSVKGEWAGADAPGGGFGCFECGPPVAIAVDESSALGDWAAGDVYVTDNERHVIDVFKPLAGGGEEYVTQLTGPEPGVGFAERPGIRGVAVSPVTGDVYVAEGDEHIGRGRVDILHPGLLPGEYEFMGTLPGPASGSFSTQIGVTIDQGNAKVYVYERFGEAADRGQLANVYEFSAAGQPTGRLTEAAEGTPLENVDGIAVDPTSHDLYLSYLAQTTQNVLDAFGPDLVIPDVATDEASGVTPEAATLNGSVDPLGEGEASCQFEWGTTPQLGSTAPCQPEGVAEGNTAAAVHADLSGLQPDTTYYFLLQASNKNGLNPGEQSQIQSFTTLGPGLGGQSVSDVTAESVSFDASVDPHGGATSVYFEYGTTEAYGSETAAESLGSGKGAVDVAQVAQGLAAGTLYHYRVAVVNEFASGQTRTFYEDDGTFTTQPLGGEFQLPDGRRWELVSPPNLHGAAMEPITEEPMQAAAGGDAIVDFSKIATEAGVEGQAMGVYVLSVRGSGGWVTRDIAIPHNHRVPTIPGIGSEYRFFSEDLSRAVVQPFGRFDPLSPEATEQTPYLRTDFAAAADGTICDEGCYRPLVTSSNTPAGTVFGEINANGECLAGPNIEKGICGPEFVGASADGRHIVLQTGVQLTETATEGLPELYEWSEGALRLVSVLPEGEANEHGGQVALEPAPGTSATTGYPLVGRLGGAVSRDGSRVLFRAKTTVSGSAHLYLRDVIGGKTVRLDLPQGGPASGKIRPTGIVGSSDLSRVFFVDEAGLTAQGSSSGTDLYEYDLQAPAGSRLRDLTADGEHPADVTTQVVGASSDGSYVYFTAAGALTANAQAGEECSTAHGLCNLYVEHEGAISLVAALSSQDWEPDSSSRASRVSPNGRYLAFMSDRSLTGYDNIDANPEAEGARDEEVFLYHAGEGAEASSLVCASCNPTGARPDGIEYQPPGDENPNRPVNGALPMWPRKAGIAAQLPSLTEYVQAGSFYQPRYLSDSGRLFFDSHDPLVPQDVGGSWGVYEYEPAGVGSCGATQSTFSVAAAGCQSLISSGTSASPSAFLDASESGGDVFFLTSQDLLPGDVNAAPHIYDARECTGEKPCLAVPVASPPPCATADACRTAPAPQPAVFGAPASALFSGDGNVPAASPSGGKTASQKRKQAGTTRAQRLTQALKRCRSKRAAHAREACVRRAKHRFGHAAGRQRSLNRAATRRKGVGR
ncbi:MAG: hypothetical protein ACRDK4_00330 [Solirubrobacteraceae bacterium]